MPTCASCGEENPDRARFCLGCGTALAVESTREVLRTVTVLFCDLVGSTALGESLDPEALRRVLVRYYEVVSAAIRRHGGAVDKYIGDAVVGVFGTPVVREDDALRAVRAATELGEEVRSLNGELRGSWGVELAIRVGVNTGRVLAADDGKAVGPVLGDAVNVAARLEAAAAAGEVLLGPLTWQLVRGAAAAEPLGPLAVRGRRDEIAAWRLTGAALGPSLARRLGRAVRGASPGARAVARGARRVRPPAHAPPRHGDRGRGHRKVEPGARAGGAERAPGG